MAIHHNRGRPVMLLRMAVVTASPKTGSDSVPGALARLTLGRCSRIVASMMMRASLELPGACS
eukprot:10054200-Alexandrium_andersonii.AAC.1